MPRIKVEEKHIYTSYERFIVGNIANDSVVQTIANFRSVEPVYPVQGTDENNRIGRKINTQFLSEEGFITLDNYAQIDSLSDYWNGFIQEQIHDLQPDSYEFPVNNLSYTIPIRHMVVEFEDEVFYNGTEAERGIYLSAWYKQLVIQSLELPTLVPSVLTDTKRESTPYTGRFTILKDNMYYLDPKSKREIHFKYKLPFKRTVNFEDGAGSDPSNVHVFSIWIGPINPYFDYFNRAFGSFLIDTPEINNPPRVAYVNSTMKLQYIDV